MANNLSKKFALLCCCLMTMQALRLVISTAGFCVVRFHIDCSLFNIFISRLVNAVLMSQLFGNWLGDLIVFTATGQLKLIGAAGAFWAEFACFCSALYCIVHTECGHLTGFYWSMVMAYFWWKVGEASAASIGGGEVDWYFSGFTLSGVWASCLKGLVMRFVADGNKSLHFHSDPLGDVNVTVVGVRSVKTTVDYRAAVWLYVITIVLTFLMCMTWTWIPFVVETLDVNSGTKEETGTTVKDVTNWKTKQAPEELTWDESDGTVKEQWLAHKGFGLVGAVHKDMNTVKWMVGIAFGGVLAVPGAMLGVGVGWGFALCFKCCVSAPAYVKLTKRCQLIFGIVGAIGGFVAGVAPMQNDAELKGNVKWMGWIWSDKWKWPWYENVDVQGNTGNTNVTVNAKAKLSEDEGKIKLATFKTLAPFMGLGVGMVTGYLIGVIIAGCTSMTYKTGKTAVAAGAFVGSFFGLISGEIYNGWANWNGAAKPAVLVCGLLIVSLGLGTVYSIYPGMAPCSITQFQYFNIIDILILFFSAIAPLVIMYADLTVRPWRLGKTVNKAYTTEDGQEVGSAWMTIGLVMLISTNVCEIIVLHIMQHPHCKMAEKVTRSPGLAVFLTVTMVTSQLVSTGVGFACVAVGSLFNDGWMNVNSTLVLWTTECCGVLGEGYLTELKKYEPGKWPTQGMGKWATYKWWNRKAFGNAWQIWCCIGTTDLRRDIMLCRQ